MNAASAISMADVDMSAKHRISVVSREQLHRAHSVLGVVCTSTRFAVRKTLANCVPFHAGQFGFTSDCVAQCENMLSVHKNQLDLAGGPLARLDNLTLRDVVKAIGHAMDSDCEPT